MTLEEAGEIIMMGHPTVFCEPCRGKGYAADSRDIPCSTCQGNGHQGIRPEYLEACRVLDRTPPEAPRSLYHIWKKIETEVETTMREYITVRP